MSSFSKMCGHCNDIMECPNGFSTSFFAGTGKSIYYHDGCIIDMFHWITKQMQKEKLEKDIKDSEMRTGWKAHSDDLDDLLNLISDMNEEAGAMRGEKLMIDGFKHVNKDNYHASFILSKYAKKLIDFVKRKSNG